MLKYEDLPPLTKEDLQNELPNIKMIIDAKTLYELIMNDFKILAPDMIQHKYNIQNTALIFVLMTQK